MIDPIFYLAEQVGILTHYKNASGETSNVSKKIILQILNLLDFPIKTNKDAEKTLSKLKLKKLTQVVEPCVIFSADETNELIIIVPQTLKDKCLRLVLESKGDKWEFHRDLSSICAKKINHEKQVFYQKKIKFPALKFGYYQCTLIFEPDLFYNVLLLVRPKKIFQPANSQSLTAIFSPLYALHSNQTIGCGDFTTIDDLANDFLKFDVNVFAFLPFFAADYKSHDVSPYSPNSRLFYNEIYLDLRKSGPFQPELYEKEITALNASPLINYQAVMAFKKSILINQTKRFFAKNLPNPSFTAFLEKRPEVKDYAKFRAIDEEDYYYHLFCQWQCDEQLKQLHEKLKARGQSLYLDLPIGSHRHGYDVYHNKDLFVLDANIGAAPDPGFPKGQNWGMSPLHPNKMRQTQYQFFIQMIRSVMSKVALLRIDHVMGFERLYWIPEQNKASEGAYVSYPSEEIYAILAIESHLNEVILIGENLGTVSKKTTSIMKKNGMYGMQILQYALDSKQSIIPSSHSTLTALNTHDMPTFYTYLKNNPEKMQLLGKKLKIKDCSAPTLLEKSLKALARSKAAILMINIEDLWGEKMPQNCPGNSTYPNWQKRLAYSLEEIIKHPNVRNILEIITKKRPRIVNQNLAVEKTKISAEDRYLFNEGTHYRLYNWLGAHLSHQNGVDGVLFTLWAPDAKSVSVIGDFNSWNKESHLMDMPDQSGIWSLFIPSIKKGDLYKFFIRSKANSQGFEKIDPLGFYHEIPPKTASIVWQSTYIWQDKEWMARRLTKQNHHAPISIYEIHLGSWKRVPEENNRFLTYRELAPLLVDYIKKMHFTHVELLPIMEHPFYGSWGYQTLGYFAPTSRYGNPDDFKYFIDYLHQNGIGVILDWVPSHFPNDEHGLARFDGTQLYEHADPRKGFHPDWKSAIFNYGRHEIKSFLISSAMFWLDHFHVDGIRVDAVASMLYLDYSRSVDEWIPNQYGGNENLEAISFLKELNRVLYLNYPDIQVFAEESTAWPKVSRPLEMGGLGFGFKWDMGWMHDTLQYFSKDPIHRKYHQHQLSFRMIYAFNENFTLPLSHDEVVHGKRSLINRMPGDECSQFANLRLLYGYMFAMPGKKLLFMGDEFAQRQEWQHEQSLDWHLLQWPVHAQLQQWVTYLNQVYQQHPALHEFDCCPEGFEWVDCQDVENSVFAFLRKSVHNEIILIVLNCTPVLRHQYRIGVPKEGQWQLIASSNASVFGGSNSELPFCITDCVGFHGRNNSIAIELPGLSILYYKWINSNAL